MAVAGWLVDKSAVVRATHPAVKSDLAGLSDVLYMCPIGELEQLYSARSADDYDAMRDDLHAAFGLASAPPDILDRALQLQRDLAHHHGLWHRISIPDLLIAETALHHDLGVIHIDADFERIAEVRPLTVRRVGVRGGS